MNPPLSIPLMFLIGLLVVALAVLGVATVGLGPPINISNYTVQEPKDVKPVPPCQDECDLYGETACFVDILKTCGYYDLDHCLEWGNPIDCSDDPYWGYCEDDQCKLLSFERFYGQHWEDQCNSVIQAADGGYVLGGYSEDGGSDQAGWLVKTNRKGETCDYTDDGNCIGNGTFARTFGGEPGIVDRREILAVRQTNDGGYIIAGRGNTPSTNAWLLKLDENGNEEWNNTYGSTSWEQFDDVTETFDGNGESTGYIAIGYTSSYGPSVYHPWLVKVDMDGNICDYDSNDGVCDGPGTFARVFTFLSKGIAVEQTSDEGFIIAARTFEPNVSSEAIWLIKTDAQGNTCDYQEDGICEDNGTFSKIFDGEEGEGTSDVQELEDGYIIVGSTYSYGSGRNDIWLLKTGENGDTCDYSETGECDGVGMFARLFGGSEGDGARSVQQTGDGGYFITGSTKSYGLGGETQYYAWLVKTDENGHTCDYTYDGECTGEGVFARFHGYNNGNMVGEGQPTDEGGYVFCGRYGSAGSTNTDFWLVKTNESGDAEQNFTIQIGKTFGGPGHQYGNDVGIALDDGFIIASNGYGGMWLIKTDPYSETCDYLPDGNCNGDGTFAKAYGPGYGYSVQQTSDGGYMGGGAYYQGSEGAHDFWLLKVDAYGNTCDFSSTNGRCEGYINDTIVFSNAFKVYGRGIDFTDIAQEAQQTSDNGYLLTGYVSGFNPGGYHDMMLVKANEYGQSCQYPGCNGLGDACDGHSTCQGDYDEDGIGDYEDNCIDDPNPDQWDFDADGIGDVCDICADHSENDADGDGLCHNSDNCPYRFNPLQRDCDEDGVGDACDLASDCTEDSDGDGRIDWADNCVDNPNFPQTDSDGDGVGDACDICPIDNLNDADGDEVCGHDDVCAFEYDPQQRNCDDDHVFVHVFGGISDHVRGTSVTEAQNGGYIVWGYAQGSGSFSGGWLIKTDAEGNVCDWSGDGICEGNGTLAKFFHSVTPKNAGIGRSIRPTHDQNFQPNGYVILSKSTLYEGYSTDLIIKTDIILDTCNPVGDGICDFMGDACDLTSDCIIDSDGDGIQDNVDNCIDDQNSDQQDTDNDGIGDACDICPLDNQNDFDLDDVCGDVDICPVDNDPSQLDCDSDGAGNACDSNQCNGFDNEADCVNNCGIPGLCSWNAGCNMVGSIDTDEDGVRDYSDNCMEDPNSGQEDFDQDTVGDACDECGLDYRNDFDGDGICGDTDICEHKYDPLQQNCDTDEDVFARTMVLNPVDIKQTTDRGYILMGESRQLKKLDEYGDVIFGKSYSDIWADQTSAVAQTPDGGYVFVGNYWDPRLHRNSAWEVWFVRTDENGDPF